MISQKLIDEARDIFEFLRQQQTQKILDGIIHLPNVTRLIDDRGEALALAEATGGTCTEYNRLQSNRPRPSHITPTGWVVEWTDREPYRRASTIQFKAKHELTDEEFAEDHWQTMFAVEHPEAVARS